MHSTPSALSLVQPFAGVYLGVGTLSLLAAALVACTYAHTHTRDHASRLILYITICDCAYTLKYMVSAVAWLAGRRDPSASFHLVSDGCVSALTYAQFTGMACISWNAAWVFDLVCVLAAPLRNTSGQRRWYHVFVWGLSASTAVYVASKGAIADRQGDDRGGGQAAASQACWQRGDATTTLVFDVPLYVYFAGAVGSIVYAVHRLSRGTSSTRTARRSLLFRHLAYVLAFIVLWMLPIVHHWVDKDSTNYAFTLMDALVASGQALVFAIIRISEPGAWALFVSMVRNTAGTIADTLVAWGWPAAWCCCRSANPYLLQAAVYGAEAEGAGGDAAAELGHAPSRQRSVTSKSSLYSRDGSALRNGTPRRQDTLLSDGSSLAMDASSSSVIIQATRVPRRRAPAPAVAVVRASSVGSFTGLGSLAIGAIRRMLGRPGYTSQVDEPTPSERDAEALPGADFEAYQSRAVMQTVQEDVRRGRDRPRRGINTSTTTAVLPPAHRISGSSNASTGSSDGASIAGSPTSAADKDARRGQQRGRRKGSSGSGPTTQKSQVGIQLQTHTPRLRGDSEAGEVTPPTSSAPAPRRASFQALSSPAAPSVSASLNTSASRRESSNDNARQRPSSVDAAADLYLGQLRGALADSDAQLAEESGTAAESGLSRIARSVSIAVGAAATRLVSLGSMPNKDAALERQAGDLQSPLLENEGVDRTAVLDAHGPATYEPVHVGPASALRSASRTGMTRDGADAGVSRSGSATASSLRLTVAAPVPGSRWNDVPVPLRIPAPDDAGTAPMITILRPRSRSDDRHDLIAPAVPVSSESGGPSAVAPTPDEDELPRMIAPGESRPSIAPARLQRMSARASATLDALRVRRSMLARPSWSTVGKALSADLEAGASPASEPPPSTRAEAATPVPAAQLTPDSTVRQSQLERPEMAMHRVDANSVRSTGTGWDVGYGLRLELGMCMLSGLCQALLESEARRLAAAELHPHGAHGHITGKTPHHTPAAPGEPHDAAAASRRRDVAAWQRDPSTLTANISLAQDFDVDTYLEGAIQRHKQLLESTTARSGSSASAAVNAPTSGGDDEFELTCFADDDFARLRTAAALSMAHIVSNFDPMLLIDGQLRAHFSDGASSSFFCRSLDQALVLKTISASEVEELMRLLPAYVQHMASNPDSLLCRFYGCFSMKLSSTSRVYFILMGNVFPIVDAGPTAETYDLKGSTIGRRARVSKSLISRLKDGRLVARGMLYQDMEFRERFPRGLPVADVDALMQRCRGGMERELTRASSTGTALRPELCTADGSTATHSGSRADAMSDSTSITVAPARAPVGSLARAAVLDADQGDLVSGLARSRAIVDQLERDVTLLAAHGLMDYSLLINVMPLSHPQSEDLGDPRGSPVTPGGADAVVIGPAVAAGTSSAVPSWLNSLPQLLPAGVEPASVAATGVHDPDDDDDDEEEEPMFGVTYRLSFNKVADLSFRDGTALARAACALPGQIAAFGSALHVSSTPGEGAPQDRAALTSPVFTTGARASLIGGGHMRMTRWSPLCVSVCALGTPVSAAGGAPHGHRLPMFLSHVQHLQAARSTSPGTPKSSGSAHTPDEEHGAARCTLYSERGIVQIGMIDMLQTYDMSKRLENTLKSLRHAMAHGTSDADISSVDPHKYAVRFMTFVRKILLPFNSAAGPAGE